MEGHNPLVRAILDKRDYNEILRLMDTCDLDKGIDLHTYRDGTRYQPLVATLITNRDDNKILLELIRRGANCHLKGIIRFMCDEIDHVLQPQIIEAIEAFRKEGVNILSEKDHMGWSPFVCCIFQGALQLVGYFLKRGAFEVEDYDKLTTCCLEILTEHNYGKDDKLKIVLMLMEEGLDMVSAIENEEQKKGYNYIKEINENDDRIIQIIYNKYSDFHLKLYQ